MLPLITFGLFALILAANSRQVASKGKGFLPVTKVVRKNAGGVAWLYTGCGVACLAVAIVMMAT